MPGSDGSGPLGKDLMTGRAAGYYMLQETTRERGQAKGMAGIDALSVNHRKSGRTKQKKEVIQMPFGDGTGPAGMGPRTGRAAGFCAGYPEPGYRNRPLPGGWRAASHGAPAYGAGAGYAATSTGWFGRWFGRGLGMGGGFARG